jgi:hypothetical protein
VPSGLRTTLSRYAGDYLRFPGSRGAGRRVRVVVKQSRSNWSAPTTGLGAALRADLAIDDVSATVTMTERYLTVM